MEDPFQGCDISNGNVPIDVNLFRVTSPSQIVPGQELFHVEEFTCSICRNLISPDELRTTPCCARLFCAPCIEGWILKKRTCPFDTEPMVSVNRTSNAVRALLESVRVYCPHNPAFNASLPGKCDWSGPRQSLKFHLAEECVFSLRRCPNRCSTSILGKKKSFSNEFRDDHNNLRTVAPEVAEELYSMASLREHLTRSCDLELVSCPNDCGHADILRQHLQDHLDNYCALQNIQCPNDCTDNANISRLKLSHHLRECCPRRMVKCSSLVCSKMLPLNEMPPHLADIDIHIDTANSFVQDLFDMIAEVGDLQEEILNLAVRTERFNILKVMVTHCQAADRSPIHLRKNENGENLLLSACAQGNVDLVQTLLQIESSDDYLVQESADKQLLTPLMWASLDGNLQVANHLLEANNSEKHLLAADQLGFTALMYASNNGQEQLVMRILEANSSKRHVVTKNQFGFSALMYACARGHTQAVKQLLQANDSEDHLLAQNQFGWTSLMYACSNGHSDVVQLLLDSNSSENYLLTPNQYQCTALMYASRNGHFPVVQKLLKANSNERHLLAIDQFGQTALMCASCKGHMQLVKLLLDANASDKHLLAQCERGWTALMWASCNGHMKLVRTLLEYNVSAEHLAIRSQKDQTAADIATQLQHTDIALLLKKLLMSEYRRSRASIRL